MANYTKTITNEGAALLASVIANQGTLTFNEFRFSENDYVGQESTLTEGTFLGVFITASAAASVIDSTTIKASAQFNNSTITGNHDLYSIGIVGTDGNTTALIAVCTTTDPDVIREPLTGTSTYAFNVNLTVSDTSQITVVGTTAAVLYDIDVVDTLTSTATDKPLSANMGRVLNENIEAIVDVYGAKNLLDINNLGSMSAYKCHVANNGFVNDDTDTLDYFRLRLVAYDSNGQIIQVGGNNYVFAENVTSTGQKEITGFTLPVGTANVLLTHTGANINIYVNPTVNLDIIGIPLTLSFNANGINPSSIGGLDIRDIMLRDARVIDPTFVPFAKTNKQLTADKAERADLATLDLTGSTNTTGVTITNGTFFYLNGQFCKALADIAANATFTLNTNYKEDTVGAEIKAVENKDTSSFSVSTESGVSLQKAICRNGFVYLQLYFAALANSTKIATITDANYLPEGGNAVGLIEPNLPAEKINYTHGSFSGSNVYVYVSGSPTSGGIITFVYPVTGY